MSENLEVVEVDEAGEEKKAPKSIAKLEEEGDALRSLFLFVRFIYFNNF